MRGHLVAVTERLELRRFSPDDAEGLFALNNEPDAIRYTGDAPFSSVDAARDFLRDYDHYEHSGFGRWSVYLRDAPTYLGFCGLKRDATDGQVDLGFRIAPAHWGRGYATEAARAAIELGFERYGLDRLIARAMPDNAASHRVLAKLGFGASGRVTDEYGDWLIYELRRSRI